MAPINTRKNRDDYKLGNQVSAMFVPIGTHIADPAARLQAVREATHNAKQMTDAVGAALMTQYGEFVPAAVSNLAQRLTAEYARASQIAPAFNCSITNVPGPQVPLYMMGCRLLTTMGYGPIVHNMGLIIPISSYCGEFTISFTSCREMIPDSQEFSDCIRQSFEAMSQSALGSNARSKIDAVARNYDKLAEQALADVRATRARANASAGVPA
jgi:hypothetical protein